MSHTKSEIEDPCENCRERHQKCTTDDNHVMCRLCKRLGATCVRSKEKLKFRHGSTARYDAAFKADQPWLKQSGNTKFQFVDETLELENHYAQDDTPRGTSIIIGEYERHDRKPSTSLSVSTEIHHTLHNTVSIDQELPPSSPPSPPKSHASFSTSRRSTANNDIDVSDLYRSPNSTEYQSLQAPIFSYRSPADEALSTQRPTSLPSTPLPPDPLPPSLSRVSLPPTFLPSIRADFASNVAKRRRLADSAAAAVPSASSGLLNPEVWKRTFFWPNDWTTTQCACLMRHFVDFIAPWFDVCDPHRHFALVVPQRARRCPPLLNAIFTASARHLSQVSRFKNQAGVVVYHGIPLYNLTPETAIQHHNAVLAYLIELSKDAEHVQDENLLAAAVILQYYEEHETSVTSEDSETFLRTFQLFKNGQVDTVSSPTRTLFSLDTQNSTPIHIDGVTTDTATDVTPLQRASFRVALRQEITAAFMKQRPIRLHLHAASWPRSFAEADDTVWANRLIVFCADVLQFCFGPDLPSGKTTRWHELKAFEKSWEAHAPVSFLSIHHKEPDRAAGAVFPAIWLLAESQAAGLLYLDLARILLAAYDPTVPRLGAGVAAAQRGVSARIRELVLRVCGVALANEPSEAALLVAQMAIAVCGEHFTDRAQQVGMLGLLGKLESEYARPTAGIVRDLERAWSCDA